MGGTLQEIERVTAAAGFIASPLEAFTDMRMAAFGAVAAPASRRPRRRGSTTAELSARSDRCLERTTRVLAQATASEERAGAHAEERALVAYLLRTGQAYSEQDARRRLAAGGPLIDAARLSAAIGHGQQESNLAVALNAAIAAEKELR